MITALRLENFRRHAETELRFADEQQILLISGRNGVGKSTLLEAVVFALYGQGRHGRRNLDRLVRRGAELEGMQVELEFTLGGTEYLVRRRRDSRVASAVLYGNSMPIVEGSEEVTAEITRILGMDVVGFRLAVIAQQKELDGLASLQPAKRAEMLSRLLRLDAISRARDEARTLFRAKRDLVVALGAGEDLPSLRAVVAEADAAASGATEALAASAEALTLLQAELAASAAVEAAWAHAQQGLAQAGGRLQAEVAEVERLVGEVATMKVPPVIEAAAEPVAELQARAADVERAIANGEAAKRLSEQYSMVVGELERVTTRLAEVNAAIPGGGSTGLAAELVTLEADLTAREAQVKGGDSALGSLREDYAAARARTAVAREKVEGAGALGSLCDACGQEIGEEHRARQLAEAEAALLEATKIEDGLLEQGRTARAEHAVAEAALVNVQALVTTKRAEIDKVLVAEAERDDLVRRENAYGAQLQRLKPEAVDLDVFYAQRAELALAIESANQAAEALRAREIVLARKADLMRSLEAARERQVAAQRALEEAAVGADLSAAYEALQETRAALDAETAISRSLAAEKAIAQERLRNARVNLDRATAALEARRRRQEEATSAANAARVLDALEARLKAQIRPALEGAVAEVLGQMSEGRFSSVSFDEQYNISVVDDGKAQPLSEFSGGESDLIALAERVALSQVVSERQGGVGLGILIFDEIFGSQDPGRRQAIMSALRNLRTTYPQIFLISHVGGLEDEADVVVELASAVDEEGALVAARA